MAEIADTMFAMPESPPIACSLPARESRDQIGEWQALARHQLTTDQIDGGYALTFNSSLRGEVEDLARRESACCGFLSITTAPTEEGIRLEITSENPDALPVIEMLVDRQG